MPMSRRQSLLLYSLPLKGGGEGRLTKVVRAKHTIVDASAALTRIFGYNKKLGVLRAFLQIVVCSCFVGFV